NENTVTGDSHQSAILGGWVSVGTSTPKRIGYNDGGYSSWNNSYALVYADGTKQLLTYSSEADAFQQRAGVGVLSPEEFFGDAPLSVLPTDNQVLPNQEILDQHSWWLDMLKGKIKKD